MTMTRDYVAVSPLPAIDGAPRTLPTPPGAFRLGLSGVLELVPEAAPRLGRVIDTYPALIRLVRYEIGRLSFRVAEVPMTAAEWLPLIRALALCADLAFDGRFVLTGPDGLRTVLLASGEPPHPVKRRTDRFATSLHAKLAGRTKETTRRPRAAFALEE